MPQSRLRTFSAGRSAGREFSYENKYIPCEKNKKDCPSGYRYDKEPSIKTVQTDRNQSARDATIEACMYGKGWREKTYYWPQW
ncbi:hypothetical protein M8494_15520 [Serratia ureilytica]